MNLFNDKIKIKRPQSSIPNMINSKLLQELRDTNPSSDFGYK